MSLSVTAGRKRAVRDGRLTEFGYLEYDLPGNAAVTVRWNRAKGENREVALALDGERRSRRGGPSARDHKEARG